MSALVRWFIARLTDLAEWLDERVGPDVTCAHGMHVLDDCPSCNLAGWMEDARMR